MSSTASSAISTIQSALLEGLCVQVDIVLQKIADSGLHRLKEGQAGQAVRLLEEARRLASEALPLAAAYNRAEPSTPAADHTEFDRDLTICIDAAASRASTGCWVLAIE